jgi:AraC-like DNA-binding protein
MAFNGKFILNIADFAANQGVDREDLIQLSGQTEEELAQDSSIVTDETYNNIIEYAIAVTKDPHLGLHMGEQLTLSAAGLIGQITQTCSTVKEALEYCCYFANLGCSALPMQLEPVGPHYKISLGFNPLWPEKSPQAFRHTVLGTLVFTLQEFCALHKQRTHPLAIHLPWEPPTDLREYQRIFVAPIHFKTDEIAMVLHQNQVERKLLTADYNLLRLLVTHAEEKSKQLQKNQYPFVQKVRHLVLQLANPAFPTIEQIAAQLNLSIRSLQRRMKAESYSYGQLTEELRKEFALAYLKRADLSISDVAYLLGYTENSTFSRAFKRWQGVSPQVWRQQ